MRDKNIDSLRGLAIIGVVFIHSSTGENIHISLRIVDGIFKFAVPLFIFISGYFTYLNKDKIKMSYKKYIYSRVKKIIIPYVVLTLISALIFSTPLKKVLFNIVFGTATVPYYYIIVIFQMYILSFYLLKKFEKNNKKFLITSFIITVSYSALYYFQLYTKRMIYIPYFMWQFPNYLFYFILGFSVNTNIWNAIKKIEKALLYPMVILFFFIELNIKYNFSLQDGDYIALTTIIYSFFTIVILWEKREFLNNKLLEILGKYSFNIFLIHNIIFDVMFKKIKIIKYPKFTLVYLVIGLVTPIILTKIYKKIKG